MEFSLDRFYRVNRKAIIWIVLFGLIYLLSDFFTLIFLTYIISFFSLPVADYLGNRLRLGYRLSVVLVYLTLLVGYIGMYVLILPTVVSQAQVFRAKLPTFQTKLDEIRTDLADKYPAAARLFSFDVESSQLSREEIIDWNRFLQQLQEDDPAANRIRNFLPTNLVTVLARKDPPPGREELKFVIPEPEPVSTPVLESPAAEEEFQESLIDAFNSLVIPNPELYRPGQFPGFDERLEERPEYEALLEGFKQGTLSTRSTEKLNRTILEATYPTLIPEREYQAERKINELIAEARAKIQEYMPNVALYLLKFLMNSMLAILFSFLIVYDYAKLRHEMQGLANSRLRDFFMEAARPVVQFAISVGQGFQAIVIIALITTVMVVVALLLLGISSVAFLAVIAFVTSLIPVVGIFFEFIPVALVALNENGPVNAFWAMVALTIIHVIVGYVVTPIVYGQKFKINLVLVLLVLFIGNQVAGGWGMILGVPVANYILRDLLGIRPGEENASASTDKKEDVAPSLE